MEINVKEARSKLSTLLNKVEKGEDVVVKRRGKRVAKLVSVAHDQAFPSLKEFRASIKISKPLSKTVVQGRQKERY